MKSLSLQILGIKVWIFLEDDEALHDGREGRVLVGGQLGSLTVGQQDGGGVGLEAGDGLGLAGLANHVHRLIQERKRVSRPVGVCSKDVFKIGLW